MTRTKLSLLLAVSLLLLLGAPHSTHAQPGLRPKDPTAIRRAPPSIRASRSGVATGPVEPPARIANVRLEIEAPTTAGTWTMRVTNEDDVPVRIVADARLITLDVTPRSARKAEHCELPQDMRPADDLQRPLVLPPKRSYVESFEPRLYCFGERKLNALAPGAIVVAHLGWTDRGARALEVSSIDGVSPEIAPRPAIDAPPIALSDEPTATSVPTLPLSTEADLPRLSLQSPRAVDATSPNGLEIPVTLRNSGTRAAIVRFRPDTLGFDLVRDGVGEHCTWPVLSAAPMRELFTTVPPKGTVTLTVMLIAFCTGHALDQGGLLIVRPRLDTRKASGDSIGLRAFDGQVLATAPTLVRLHEGLSPAPLVRPRLAD
jgi:hypothetical protein